MRRLRLLATAPGRNAREGTAQIGADGVPQTIAAGGMLENGTILKEILHQQATEEQMKFQAIRALATLGLACVMSNPATAASGEMGTGVPRFGIYSDPVTAKIQVWSLDDATISFPAGCTQLVLNPATMGLDAYKLAAAALIAAKVSGLRIRFYAHAPRDGGCGVDTVELQG